MKLFRSPWTRVPDDEYIAKLRRSIASFDRWRFWWILFYVGLLVLAIWIHFKVISVLIGIAQRDNVPFELLGFVTGTVIGIGFGWMAYGILHGLMSTLGGFRAERLLLTHLDRQDSGQCASERHVQQGSDFKELLNASAVGDRQEITAGYTRGGDRVRDDGWITRAARVTRDVLPRKRNM